jgi:hypothetical protein
MFKRNIILSPLFSGLFQFLGAQTIPNSGFENWVQQGPGMVPTAWGNNPTATKSTDAHSGSFAVQCKTDSFTDPMGNVKIMPGILFLGMRGMGPNSNLPGSPFNIRPDSFVGWFKYAPKGQDAFKADVLFTKWNTTWNKQDTIGKAVLMGDAAVNYTRFSIPVEYSSWATPDSVQISFGSGNPQNPELGSTLIIDDISFVTKPNASVKELNNQLNVFPNPTNGTISINHNIAKTLDIYKLDGSHIKSYKIEGQETLQIDISYLSNGIYLISNNNNQHTTFIKQ